MKNAVGVAGPGEGAGLDDDGGGAADAGVDAGVATKMDQLADTDAGGKTRAGFAFEALRPASDREGTEDVGKTQDKPENPEQLTRMLRQTILSESRDETIKVRSAN